jgi:CRISPR/Cas system-associated exonuclease Cas4 (RecB family)
MRISPTLLGTFDWCKRQYYYKYILHLPTIETPAMRRGTYVHKLISNWINGTNDDVPEVDEWGRETGNQIVANILKELEPVMLPSVLSEQTIWRPYGEDTIGGIIDYFDNEKIIDFKAVDKIKTWRSPVQLAIYRWVIGRREKYCYLQGTTKRAKWLCYTNADLDAYDELWKREIDEIKLYTLKYELAGEEFPARKTKYCKLYCSYYDVCWGKEAK